MKMETGHQAEGKVKIRKKMYYIFVPAIVIPSLFIGFFLIFNLAKNLFTQTYSQLESDNYRVKSILLDCTINFFNISEDLLNDKSVTEFFMSDSKGDYGIDTVAAVNKRIEYYQKKNTAISSIVVYTDNPVIADSKYIRHIPDVKNKWAGIINIPTKSSWYYTPAEDVNTNTPELTFSRSIPLIHSEYSAVLVITVSNNFLKNRIDNNLLYTAVSLNQGLVFFSSIRSMQGKNQNMPVDYGLKYYRYKGLTTFNNKNVLGYISSLPVYQSEDILYISSMDLAAYNSIIKTISMCIAITLLAVLIPLAGILFYTRTFSARVVALRTAMHNLSVGNYDIIDTLRGDDELTDTFSYLKNMIQNIKAKEAQMYEAQIQQKELINQQQKMEFKILASQINPHFIYNTLETIRMMALDSDNLNVASAIKLLGKSMRYVLERTETFSTTLDKELDYIDVYLQLQKLRFGERLQYSIEIQNDFSPRDYRILPLLLQPIVENSVLHGLETVLEGGIIKVVVKSDNKSLLFIDIFDNGKGMTSEQLDDLKEKIDKRDDSERIGIGLRNISQRIKLFYGEPYNMHIVSSTRDGTHISIVLPLIPDNSH